ncbi:MAG: hypothetical protein Q8Q78_00340 [Hydrogenophaga sp.]|nr:hypothetical protein [Hydrogenophaga sp.]
MDGQPFDLVHVPSPTAAARESFPLRHKVRGRRDRQPLDLVHVPSPIAAARVGCATRCTAGEILQPFDLVHVASSTVAARESFPLRHQVHGRRDRQPLDLVHVASSTVAARESFPLRHQVRGRRDPPALRPGARGQLDRCSSRELPAAPPGARPARSSSPSTWCTWPAPPLQLA